MYTDFSVQRISGGVEDMHKKEGNNTQREEKWKGVEEGNDD